MIILWIYRFDESSMSFFFHHVQNKGFNILYISFKLEGFVGKSPNSMLCLCLSWKQNLLSRLLQKLIQCILKKAISFNKLWVQVPWIITLPSFSRTLVYNRVLTSIKITLYNFWFTSKVFLLVCYTCRYT